MIQIRESVTRRRVGVLIHVTAPTFLEDSKWDGYAWESSPVYMYILNPVSRTADDDESRAVAKMSRTANMVVTPYGVAIKRPFAPTHLIADWNIRAQLDYLFSLVLPLGEPPLLCVALHAACGFW
jgi:hypothetical protein